MGLSRDQLARIVEASPLAIFSIDRERTVLSWNAASERLFGWTAVEVLGQRLPTIGPEHELEHDAIRTRVFGGESTGSLLLTRLGKGGVRLLLDFVAMPLVADDGAVIGGVAFCKSAFQREDQQLGVILDAIPAPIFFKDADGVYRGCNKAFEAYLGKPRDEIIGKDVYGLSPKDLADVYKRADDDLFARRGLQIYEAAVRYADGSRHDVMFHKATFDGADGRLAGLVGTILDITVRKQAERALLESERDLAMTLDSLVDGVIRTGGDGCVVRMNPVAEQLTGWTLHEARGRPLGEVLVMTGADDVRALRARDGTLRAIEISTTVIQSGESGAVTIFRDITDQRRAREAQRSMQDRLGLADRMSSIGTLAGGVAHEINNPLSYVIGNLTLLDEDLRRRGLPELRHLVSDALDGGERIRRIVRDLKTFARSDDDVRGPISVPRVLELALGVAASELRHRAKIVRELREVPPVIGNEARLGQVFVNLLVNAAQAIAEGHAEQNQIRVVCHLDGVRVVVEVHDTGSGMPEAVRARIFEPFFTTKPIGTGTGLGLAASHGIVASMGGEIAVDSEPGRGSVFRVSLPAAAGARARVTEPPPPGVIEASGRRGRILIADDEPIVSRTLARFLQRDHDVTVAANGREALDAIAREHFDVILCDLMMPVMTGMDVHAALAERDPPTAARIIFMTGGAFTARARDFLDRVPNARLEKPFTMPVLEALIRDRVR